MLLSDDNMKNCLITLTILLFLISAASALNVNFTGQNTKILFAHPEEEIIQICEDLEFAECWTCEDCTCIGLPDGICAWDSQEDCEENAGPPCRNLSANKSICDPNAKANSPFSTKNPAYCECNKKIYSCEMECAVECPSDMGCYDTACSTEKAEEVKQCYISCRAGGKNETDCKDKCNFAGFVGGEELPEYEEPSENIDWLGELADWFGAKSVSTDIGEMSYEQVLDNEAKKGTKGGTGFKFWWLNSTFDDGPLGAIARDFAGIKSPFTYNSPKTSEFFNSVEQISGSEMERIQSTYSLVAEAVPNYGAPGSDSTDLSKNSTFEEVLSCSTGICRDQAGLLAAALRKQDIDASVVNGSEHAWVRVTLSEGSNADRQFDLDSTWYKDFVPLPLRK